MNVTTEKAGQHRRHRLGTPNGTSGTASNATRVVPSGAGGRLMPPTSGYSSAETRITTPDAPTTRVVRTALAGLASEPLADQITGDLPTEDSVVAVKQTILNRLDDEERVASYWQLLDALEGVDHYTLRVALEELQDDDRVQTAAVFWRRDRVDGDGVDALVEGVVGEGGDGA